MTLRTLRIGAVAAGLTAVVGAVLVHATAAESTHIIRLSGNRFAPSEVVVHAGDSLQFVNSGGGIHNIAFQEDALTPEERRELDAAMPQREEFRATGEATLASPLLVSQGEVYAFRIPALPPGRYPFYCIPHVGAGMKGTLVVVR